MIYEYAVDPKLIVTLGDFPDLAWWLVSQLGNDTGCVVSEYPKDIDRAIYKELKEQIRAASEDEKIHLQKKRAKIEEIAARIKVRHPVGMAKRKNSIPWTGIFSDEHQRHPFDFVLAESGAMEGQRAIPNVFEWLRDPDSHLHQSPSSLLVSRTADELSNAVAPILKNAREITFIDPYFLPYNNSFCDAFKYYLRRIPCSTAIRGALPRSVTMICNANAKFTNQAGPPSAYSEVDFKAACESELPQIIPSGILLRIRRAREKRGESNWHKLHNRFLLTDIGGIAFGHGIDCRSQPGDSSKDTLSLLSSVAVREIKNMYNPTENFFDWSEPVIEIL